MKKKWHLQQHRQKIDVDTDRFISFIKEFYGVKMTLHQEIIMRKMYENKDIGLYVTIPRKQNCYNITLFILGMTSVSNTF